MNVRNFDLSIPLNDDDPEWYLRLGAAMTRCSIQASQRTPLAGHEIVVLAAKGTECVLKWFASQGGLSAQEIHDLGNDLLDLWAQVEGRHAILSSAPPVWLRLLYAFQRDPTLHRAFCTPGDAGAMELLEVVEGVRRLQVSAQVAFGVGPEPFQ